MCKKNEEKLNNEQLHPVQTLIIKWISVIVTSVAAIFSIAISLISNKTVNDVKESNKESIAEIKNKIENIIKNEQTVDVIQARDNDVLIKTPDGKWLVIPMIAKNDIEFSNQIIEKQYNSGECDLERKDINNKTDADWTSRDSFTYTLQYLSINQDKMVSLKNYINSIDVIFKLFLEDKKTYQDFPVEIYKTGNNYAYLNVFEDIMPSYQFVTKEFNDGIEDIKISVHISFEVSEDKFTIPYYFDDWMTVNQDY